MGATTVAMCLVDCGASAGRLAPGVERRCDQNNIDAILRR
jgi:hypothetical protein